MCDQVFFSDVSGQNDNQATGVCDPVPQPLQLFTALFLGPPGEPRQKRTFGLYGARGD